MSDQGESSAPETGASAGSEGGTAEPEVTAAPAAAAPAAAAASSAPAASAPTASKSVASDVKDPDARGARKVREGTVISDKMDSTVVVAVIERVRHARYGKTVQRTKKLYAHDDHFEARVGDRVRVAETRPLSKLKRWRVTEVMERAR
jgi:small subunit ribosomal protein S17